MKNRFLFIFLFTSLLSFAQTTIKGTVYYNNTPLESVAVYFNNTMVGTTTDENGEFSIEVKKGQYELIISFLGFKKINYTVNTSVYNKPLAFSLKEEKNMLDEIIIKKTVYDDEWKHNLAVFRNEFIGRTELSKDCKILNPEVLYFDFDAKKSTLSAFARKPLLIKNKGLGYFITYELENFVRTKNSITYLGYTRYEELKGGKRKQKRWKKNRLKTYNGSATHFYKSITENSFKEDGFVVNQFKRVLNTERPSEIEIKKARELIKLSRTTINFSKSFDPPKNALDSALVVSKKARLPKFKDYLYKSQLKKENIIIFKNNAYQLCFDNNLSVVYNKEKEEMGYITRNVFSKKRDPLPQTSSIILLNKNITIGKNGTLINPLDVFYEGYWSYEKFANTLPLDYLPVGNLQ